MASVLDDGTVIPHFLGMRQSNSANAFYDNLNVMSIFPGEVIAAYPPSSKQNVSKKFYEYDVLVYRHDGNGPTSTQVFHNCLIKDTFGSASDFVRFTPRITKVERDGKRSSYNSRVMVQCLNGDTATAVIVGFIKHDLLYGEKGKEKDLGHNLEFEFNGVNVEITKDGDFRFTRKGATKETGEPVDKDDTDKNGGFQLIMDKAGGLKAVTGDGNQYMEINHADKRIDIDADEGVHLGGDDEPLMLGKTYCEAEDQFLQDMQSALQSLSGAINQLTTGLGALTCAAPGSPVVGAQVAAAASGQMTSAVANMIKACTTFKTKVTGGKQAQVLSPKNTTK
jgi:hypothetical protein